MDHVVYLDSHSKELEAFVKGQKRMIIRGGFGRIIPFGRVKKGDMIYLLENNGKGVVQARGEVTHVTEAEKLSSYQSLALIEVYQSKLQLSEHQLDYWKKKKSLVLVQIGQIQIIEPFKIKQEKHKSKEDWLLVGDIEKVII